MANHNPLLCQLCGNTGMVSIYHQQDVVHVQTHGAAPLESGHAKQQFAVVACKCRLGNNFSRACVVRGRDRALPVFGTAWWHVRPRIIPGDVGQQGRLYDVRQDVLEALQDAAEDNPFNRALAEG